MKDYIGERRLKQPMTHRNAPRLVFLLPTIGACLDRVRLLVEVSKGLHRLTLLADRKIADVDITRLKRLRIVDVGYRRA